MNKKWTVVDALRHSRHDWLNRLQLIKAHVSLGNEERVQELIGEFVGEAQQEAHLVNLRMPLFTELLLTYSWNNEPCLLEYEVLGTIHNAVHLDAHIYAWTETFLSVLHSSLHIGTENHLSITIQCEEEDIRFFFDFRGKLMDMNKLEQWLANSENHPFHILYSLHEEEASIELQCK